MKVILIFLVSYFSLTNIFAQNSWEWQNFVPGEIISICFIDSLNGWAVSVDREILHTSNGGKNWEYQKTLFNESVSYYDVFFLNENEGWICGKNLENAILLHTTDSGVTWEKNDFTDREWFSSVYFIDENNGWVGSDSGKIFSTQDGGDSWNCITIDSSDPYSGVDCIQFLNKNTGFAIMGYSIIKTEDSGASWQIQYTDDSDYYLSSLCFSDSLHGWVIGEIRKLLYTTDGGNTWLNDTTFAKWDGYLTDIFFVDSLNGFIIGRYGIELEKGFICKTIDGGVNWTRKENFKALNSITAVDKKYIWTAGLSSIYYSSDFGIEWKSQVSEMQCYFSSLFCIDDMHVWTTGGSNSNGLYETDDGGNTWNKKLNVYGEDLYFIDNKGWVISENWLYRSEDSFNTWSEQPLQFFIGGAKSIYFVNENVGFCVGWAGPIIKTIDGGKTWIVPDTSQKYYLRSVYFLDENHGWAAGTYLVENNQPTDKAYGYILRTTDGGQSWSEYITDDSFWLADIFFIDENIGWAVGTNNDHYEYPLLHTTDGGVSWTRQSSFSSNSLTSVFFIDKNTGWVTHSKGRIYKSTDGGDTWTLQFPTSPYSGRPCGLNAVQFINEDIGWVVGDNGAILKTTNGGSTFVENKDLLKLDNKVRLYANFPNPFNPSTTIEYQIPSRGLVKLKIYDITGQEITTLINKEQLQGRYKVVFKTPHLASGIYFCKLQVSLNNGHSFSKSMKMVLLR